MRRGWIGSQCADGGAGWREVLWRLADAVDRHRWDSMPRL